MNFGTISPKRLLYKAMRALVQADSQGLSSAAKAQAFEKVVRAQKRVKRERSRKQLLDIGIDLGDYY